MCGIVGLFMKDPALEAECGALLADMLESMSDRGPDSAGFAVYTGGEDGMVKLTVHFPAEDDSAKLAAQLGKAIGVKIAAQKRDTHTVLSLPAAKEPEARAALAALAPQARIVSAGKRMEIYKEVGLPAEVAKRFDLKIFSATHAIGHTRMATESAVTTNGAHPFTTGRDQCLVHNGSLSNHASLRRELKREGLTFETENDSEVAAAYLTSRMNRGDNLSDALKHSLTDLDGFYTFVTGAENSFGVLRDPISCKPAIMAETERYVAFGSEYRALVNLPGIKKARVWEPQPATPYFWERAA
jgi:glutamate synthase domain-containing protein 1